MATPIILINHKNSTHQCWCEGERLNCLCVHRLCRCYLFPPLIAQHKSRFEVLDQPVFNGTHLLTKQILLHIQHLCQKLNQRGHTLARVTFDKEPMNPGEGIVSLAMQEVNGGAKDIHLMPHGCNLVADPWEEVTYGSELLSTVPDVPDLIVKVPEMHVCVYVCVCERERERGKKACSVQ